MKTIFPATLCRTPRRWPEPVRSILLGDTPVVTAVLFIFAVLVIVFNLVADVLYGVLDPRIRYT